MSDAVLYFKRAPSAPIPQVVGATPAVLTNSSTNVQVYAVTGGVVTLIEVDLGAGFLPAVGIAGVFALMPAQALRITYAVTPPTVNMVQY